VTTLHIADNSQGTSTKAIAISDLSAVEEGCNTDNFERHLGRGVLSPDPAYCFSLISTDRS
jgi:hypothetical protein